MTDKLFIAVVKGHRKFRDDIGRGYPIEATHPVYAIDEGNARWKVNHHYRDSEDYEYDIEIEIGEEIR